MTVIHMDTVAVEGALQHLRRGLLEIEAQNQKLKRARHALMDVWIGGPAVAEYHEKFEDTVGQLSASCQALEILEQKLTTEFREWVEAASRFGEGIGAVSAVAMGAAQAPIFSLASIEKLVCGVKSGGDQARCTSIWNRPPNNAEELAYMVMNLPATLPIVILQIGNGAYLILMRGTTSGEDEGSNWGSAAESMFGSSSYQNSVLNALKNAKLPGNAKLHFAGHSQGGMIAQNLAVDPRLLGKFDVKSVTMFGSPDTLAKANPNVRYVSFEAAGDIVPKLDEIVKSTGIGQGLDLVTGGGFSDVSMQAERHIITNSLDALNPIPDVSHSVYDNPGVLSDYDVPFQADTWKGINISSSRVSTLGPVLYKVGKKIKGAVDVVNRIQSLGAI